jgi:hypothetical protein
MSGPVYTVPELRRKTLLLLVALGANGGLLAGALVPLHLEVRMPDGLTSTCIGVVVVTGLAGLILSLLLGMTLIALGLLSWAHRHRIDDL